MDYIDGRTLEDIVDEKGPIHPEDVCWITERLLGALYYIHFNGVIHSDVKPQNVFVEPSKRDIKLIDFGLSYYKPKSTSKAIGYTPRYAAPEQLTNTKTDITYKADQFAIGVIAYFILTGQFPYGDVCEIEAQILPFYNWVLTL